jgi:uncharacterized protein
MPNPVIHFEVVTKNPKAAIEFFNAAFDWNIDTQHPGSGSNGVPVYFYVAPNGDMPPSEGINGGVGGTPDGYGGHVTFYVSVDDVGAALDKIESLGGTRMIGPDRVPDGPTIGLFKDPQGNTIGLVDVAPAEQGT